MAKVFLLFIMVFVLPNFLISQNLVPNPSFECGTDICDPVTRPSNFNEYACDWTCPTKGSTDILSTLIPNKSCYASVPYNDTDPYNHIGSQLPRTGNRFAGIYCHNRNSVSSYREYLQVQLKTSLIPGEYYCAEMYVSSADVVNFSCNNIGMYFSDSETILPEYTEPLLYLPQIIEKNIINDTVNWVRISGTFMATSPAKYLIIGNFHNNAETQIIRKVGPPFLNYYDYAYYFIDDVSVEHLPKPNFAYTGNTEICQGESTTLKIPGFEDVTWTTLADTLTILSIGDSLRISPQETTQYRVKVRNCHLTVKDTLTVTVNTFLKVDLGNDTTICEGSSIKLNAGSFPGSEYTWQDQSTNQYLTANEAGNYSVSVKNQHNNCVGYDEVNITIETVPKIELGRDTIVCEEFFPLKAGEGNSQYQWSTGSSDSVFTPSESGKYWVMVENQCGQSSDTINIHSTNDIFAPNVLTLNDDDLNEEFRLVVMEGTSQKLDTSLAIEGKLRVFDRWGGEIFSNNNYANEWPPKSEDVATGVYYFTFDYLGCRVYKGWVRVLR